jgi:hypothetical protein
MINANLSLVRGDDSDVGVYVTNPDGGFYNLSGCSLTFTVRESDFFSAPPILQKIVTGHYGAASGASIISFASGDTAGLGDRSFYYDIKLFSTGQKLTTLVYGKFLLSPI